MLCRFFYYLDWNGHKNIILSNIIHIFRAPLVFFFGIKTDQPHTICMNVYIIVLEISIVLFAVVTGAEEYHFQ